MYGNPDEVRDIGARGDGGSIDSMTQQEKESRNIDWIKTVLDPRSFNMQPDQVVENNNSVPNAIDITMEYVVADPRAPVTTANSQNVPGYYAEQCPSKTGMILHFPQRGAASIYHMGFVGINATSSQPIHIPISSPAGRTVWQDTRGLSGAPSQYQGAPNFNLSWAGASLAAVNAIDNIGAFQWTGTVALPRIGSAEINTGIEIGASFSKVRVYAGLFQLSGNAVSMTAASLTGTVSAGVVADTRDLAAPANGGDVWATPSIAQQSVSRKDVIKSSNLDEGVTSIIGDDYQRHFDAPDKSVTRRQMGESYQVTQPLSFLNNIVNNIRVLEWNNYVPTAGCSMWITPWSCNHYYALNGNGTTSSTGGIPTYHNLIRIPPIDETGSCRINVTVPWDAFFTGTGFLRGQQMDTTATDYLANIGAEVRVLFIHRYCNINDDGTVNYNSRSEIQRETRSVANHQWYQSYLASTGPSGLDNIPFPSPIFSSDAAQFRGDFVKQGKYVGTYVQIFFAPAFTPYRPRNGTTPNPSNTTDYGLAPADGGYGVCLQMEQPRIEVTATTIDEPGNIGPCHIVRYDNVSSAQTLLLKGMFRFQGNPNGSIAPFVQDTIQSSKYVFSSQVQGLLRALFRSNPLFRRMMTTRYYDEAVLPYVRELSAGSLIQESSNKAEVVAHGEQAGLFKSIGSGIGSFADTFFGGAAGQFGMGGGFGGGAAGQFGMGGGLNGGAYGQYGLSSGRRNFRA